MNSGDSTELPSTETTSPRLRPAVGADAAFLRLLFAESRPLAERMMFADHPAGKMLLDMQFEGRRRTYGDAFPQAMDWIVLDTEDRPIGRLLMNRERTQIRLVDIALLPAAQGQGLGTSLLRWLQQEAMQARLPIGLSVAFGSPARRLYERAGFVEVSASETDTEMLWTAPKPVSRVKLPFVFDVDRLRDDLAKIAPDEWISHFNTAQYEGDWSGVALRSVGGKAAQIYPDPTASGTFAPTEILDRCPYFREVLETFRCPLEAARLLKLRAGSSIREHSDFRLGYEVGEVRLHIPIVTDPAIAFIVAGERVDMRPGETWYVNVNLPHRVDNHATIDRVHLVIDCLLDDWLREFFPPEMRGATPPTAPIG